MVNSNAARHLLLVVTVLLCFFVYMGHLIWGRAAAPDVEGGLTPTEIAGLTQARNDMTQTSLMTVNDSPSVAPPTVRAPIATPTGTPQPLGGRESVPDLGAGLTPPARQEPPSLAPPASPQLKPPSGSIEESVAAGDITSLGPDRSTSPSPGLALGLPEQPTERASGDSRSEEPRGSLAPPPADSGLKPPSSSGLQPPAADAASTPRRDDPPASRPEPNLAQAGESAGSLAPPPSGLPSTRPTAPSSGVGLAPPPPGGGSDRLAPPPAAGSGGGMRPTASPVAPRDASPPAPGGMGLPPTNARPVAPNPGSPSSGSEDMRVYIIRPGDTLSRIAARELGSASLANNIFLFNRGVIDDPDQLIVGTRILLPANDNGGIADPGQPRTAPPAVPVAPGVTAATPPPPARPEAGVAPGGQQTRVHRVARGDTLSSIALRYYGSSAAWRFLYESNADVISNPNQLQVGTELVIPLYGERR